MFVSHSNSISSFGRRRNPVTLRTTLDPGVCRRDDGGIIIASHHLGFFCVHAPHPLAPPPKPKSSLPMTSSAPSRREANVRPRNGRMVNMRNWETPSGSGAPSSPAPCAQQPASALDLPYQTVRSIAPMQEPLPSSMAAQWPDAPNAIVTGHQPTLGRVAALLCFTVRTGDVSREKRCDVVVLKRGNREGRREVRLKAMMCRNTCDLRSFLSRRFTRAQRFAGKRQRQHSHRRHQCPAATKGALGGIVLSARRPTPSPIPSRSR